MKHWCVALLTLVILRGVPISAQAGPPPLPAAVTLDDVLKLLEERSPRTAAERASVLIAI